MIKIPLYNPGAYDSRSATIIYLLRMRGKKIPPISEEQKNWLISRRVDFKFSPKSEDGYLELNEEDAAAFLLTFPELNNNVKKD